jgi:hypothetical protein
VSEVGVGLSGSTLVSLAGPGVDMAGVDGLPCVVESMKGDRGDYSRADHQRSYDCIQ